MTLQLDHVAIVAETLDAGVAHVEAVLGVPVGAGGSHPLMGTHNRLMRMGDVYLEVIAIDPAAPPPGRRRWFGLDDFRGPPRLGNWILRTDDLEGALAAAPPGTGQPLSLSRGDLRWRMAVPESGLLPFDTLYPALIEWDGAHPLARMTDSGCRLLRLIVSHPEAGKLAAAVPLADSRVELRPGPPGLGVEIMTPTGPRLL